MFVTFKGVIVLIDASAHEAVCRFARQELTFSLVMHIQYERIMLAVRTSTNKKTCLNTSACGVQ